MALPILRGSIAAILWVVVMLAWRPALIAGFQGRDVAGKAGLTAINVSGDSDRKEYILESTGAGVAIFDFDNDGLMDVFLVNGTSLDGKGPGEKSTSHLYRNLGKLRLKDVTAKSGLGRTGWGQGACVGDYDNDGRDLFVTYYGHSVLYHNEGGGVIRDGARVPRGWIGSGVVIYRHSANRHR